MKDFLIEKTLPQGEYKLLDSGEGEKLEQYGKFVLARPDPQAIWPKRLLKGEWENADAYFKQQGAKGKWMKRKELPEAWNINLNGLVFAIELSPFKHTGVFPEQLSNWNWMREKITHVHRPTKILNLFGYTGGATLAAAQAGAEVIHVDASRSSIGRARDNTLASGLENAKIRWIQDDAHKFVEREVRRKSTYDGIILDPPAYGRGAKGEIWKLEENLLSILNSCKKLLTKAPLFFVLNGYASGYSAIAYKNILETVLKDCGGKIEAGELGIEDVSGKILPAGIFARWSKE